MAKNTNPKYELIKVGKLPVHRSDQVKRFYQVKALRDIPEHNVKAGDLGGYVTHKKALSHYDSCWIGEEAQVIGPAVTVIDNAYVGGKAVVQTFPSKTRWYSEISIENYSKVFDEATVISRYTASHAVGRCSIKDASKVYGNALIDSVWQIIGASKIYDSAQLIHTNSIDNCEIYDNAKVGATASLKNCSVYNTAVISEWVEAESSVIYGDAVILRNKPLDFGTVIEGTKILKGGYKQEKSPVYQEIPSLETLISKPDKAIGTGKSMSRNVSGTISNVMLETYEDLCSKISSYETDIVKIIQYPVMADKTDPFTLEMTLALNSAKRYSCEPQSIEFKDAVAALEKAFVMAESNARKVASSLFSETEKKKASKAKDLFRVASNEASSEQEKKAAFIQGFKQLEGVLDVPDSAVDAFRIKIGLPELEM